MIKKAESKTRAMLKYALLVPLITCLTGINVSLNAQNLNSKPQEKPDEDEKIFVSVEENPEFPGGAKALYEYIAENMYYPEEAMENGIQGKVVIRFVVEKDGTVDNVEILRGFDKSCDAEAVRVIKSLPKFISGKQNGIPVRVYYTIPINFKLQDNPNEEKKIEKSEGIKLSPLKPESTANEGNPNKNEDIYDEEPKFPGGREALYKYIFEIIRYPIEAAEKGIQGKTTIRFVVEKDGTVNDVVVLRGFNKYCDAEAVRVVKSLPKFIPGKKNGEPVRVYFTMPINFKLGPPIYPKTSN
ncbi:MAG: TonB family protein [Paludibacter sp.]|nr:TonB family protein [Paludibacter sp.]